MESSERRLRFRPDYQASVVHFLRKEHNEKGNQRNAAFHLAKNRSLAETLVDKQ